MVVAAAAAVVRSVWEQSNNIPKYVDSGVTIFASSLTQKTSALKLNTCVTKK